eukprot:7646301-Pyramimonas_sp.AAC.1
MSFPGDASTIFFLRCVARFAEVASETRGAPQERRKPGPPAPLRHAVAQSIDWKKKRPLRRPKRPPREAQEGSKRRSPNVHVEQFPTHCLRVSQHPPRDPNRPDMPPRGSQETPKGSPKRLPERPKRRFKRPSRGPKRLQTCLQ